MLAAALAAFMMTITIHTAMTFIDYTTMQSCVVSRLRHSCSWLALLLARRSRLEVETDGVLGLPSGSRAPKYVVLRASMLRMVAMA